MLLHFIKSSLDRFNRIYGINADETLCRPVTYSCFSIASFASLAIKGTQETLLATATDGHCLVLSDISEKIKPQKGAESARS